MLSSNGRIDKAELRSLLESHSDEERVSDHLLHHWLSEGEVERVMAMYDLDHSGDLSLEEFQNLVRPDDVTLALVAAA